MQDLFYVYHPMEQLVYKFQVYISNQLKLYRFYLTFCNIPVLAENQPFHHIVLGDFFCVDDMFLIYCPFYTNTDIDICFVFCYA